LKWQQKHSRYNGLKVGRGRRHQSVGRSRFGKNLGFSQIRKLQDELRLLGAQHVVISSNVHSARMVSPTAHANRVATILIDRLGAEQSASLSSPVCTIRLLRLTS
jgi:hypothetical protein